MNEREIILEGGVSEISSSVDDEIKPFRANYLKMGTQVIRAKNVLRRIIL